MREPITIDPDAGTRVMEAYGRASVGLPPRRMTDERDDEPDVVRRYRAANPPVTLARWRIVLPMVTTAVTSVVVVGTVAFILVRFG